MSFRWFMVGVGTSLAVVTWLFGLDPILYYIGVLIVLANSIWFILPIC